MVDHEMRRKLAGDRTWRFSSENHRGDTLGYYVGHAQSLPRDRIRSLAKGWI